MEKSIYFILCALFILSACSASTPSKKEALGPLAAEAEAKITSSGRRIPDLIAKKPDVTARFGKDEFYNITPTFIEDHSSYVVFKSIRFAQTFLMYADELYSPDEYFGFGGYGITSMALADLNQDGEYELYFTFSWGSGVHWAEIGYFDPAAKEFHRIDYHLLDSELMLTVNQSGDLCVSSATLDSQDFCNYTIKAQELIGTIGFEEGKAVLNPVQKN